MTEKEIKDLANKCYEAGKAEMQASIASQAEQILQEEYRQLRQQVAQFKNFHRNLCERFGYCHDEVDWKRDQVSLEEHSAKQVAAKDEEIARLWAIAEVARRMVHGMSYQDQEEMKALLAALEKAPEE